MQKKIILLIVIFIIIFYRITNINVINKNQYLNMLDKKINNYFYSTSSPRGRILDRNGVVLVDNVGVKTVFYKKNNDIKQKEELEIAYALANIIDVKINNDNLKKYWLIINNNGDNLITKDEYKLLNERKIDDNTIINLKYERITEEMVDELSDLDKEAITIYELMNRGYSYDKKEIIRNISDEEYNKIIESNLKGIFIDLTWERKYNYGDVLKDVFGSVGYIPKDNIDEYLKNGYNLNDTIGLSYLEKYYEQYLKGEKDLYKVNNYNTLTKIKDGKKGNDLVLSIDINVQLKLEEIIKKNIINAKKRKNTDYFSEVYSIIGNPNTGEIIAFSGQKLVDYKNLEFKNVNTNLINTSYTVGSVVKMGTISTGYKNGIIDIGSTVNDGCIKLYQVPIKCSYKRLGRINDLTAISKSSNYYQFNIALGLTGNKYKYNMKLNTNIDDFSKFREVFKSYGLGDYTGIDLPNETLGIIGNNTSSDLLLNLSIGQYDTYTPIELFQYVNTIAASGEKRKPQLMQQIIKDNEIVNNKYEVIGNVDLDNKYLDRIKEAMHLATTSGTARGYINSKYNPAGKTGTSETFIDTNNDGKMDTKTTSIAFVGFAPYDSPEYSIVVLAPNIYVSKDYNYSKVYITRYISHDIMNFLFEK